MASCAFDPANPYPYLERFCQKGQFLDSAAYKACLDMLVGHFSWYAFHGPSQEAECGFKQSFALNLAHQVIAESQSRSGADTQKKVIHLIASVCRAASIVFSPPDCSVSIYPVVVRKDGKDLAQGWIPGVYVSEFSSLGEYSADTGQLACSYEKISPLLLLAFSRLDNDHVLGHPDKTLLTMPMLVELIEYAVRFDCALLKDKLRSLIKALQLDFSTLPTKQGNVHLAELGNNADIHFDQMNPDREGPFIKALVAKELDLIRPFVLSILASKESNRLSVTTTFIVIHPSKVFDPVEIYAYLNKFLAKGSCLPPLGQVRVLNGALTFFSEKAFQGHHFPIPESEKLTFCRETVPLLMQCIVPQSDRGRWLKAVKKVTQEELSF